MHIEDKRALYKNFYNTLKPGGQLLVTDYCWGDMVSRVMVYCRSNIVIRSRSIARAIW